MCCVSKRHFNTNRKCVVAKGIYFSQRDENIVRRTTREILLLEGLCTNANAYISLSLCIYGTVHCHDVQLKDRRRFEFEFMFNVHVQ